MGIRFQKRVKLAPGITLNMGTSGCSFSFGQRGARVTVGKNGVRKTIGIPGTGLSYSSYDSFGGKKAASNSTRSRSAAPSSGPQQNDLDVGFFSGLFLSGDEKTFIEGIKALLRNDISAATDKLSQIPDVADAGLILAVLLLNAGDYQQCRGVLDGVVRRIQDLGALFKKYNLNLNLTFPITDLLDVELEPSPLSVDLLRVEAFQHTNDAAAACNLLKERYQQDNTNLLVKISLAELVLTAVPDDVRWLKSIVSITGGIENDTPVHTVLLYYRGVAFEELGQYDDAQKVFAGIARKKKDRDNTLLWAIQEERARIYELTGHPEQADRIRAEIPPADIFPSDI